MLSQSILKYIFSYLPQRSIYECLRVNKYWQYSAEEQLYEFVHFYNEESVFMFYQLITNVKLTTHPTQTITAKTSTTSGKLKSTLVQHIYIHFQSDVNINSILFCLQSACLHIKSITLYDKDDQVIHNSCNHHNSGSSFFFLHPILPHWRSITHFPSWHGDSMEYWIYELAKQLTHVSLQLNKDYYVDEQNENNKLAPFSLSFFSKRIFFKTDHILQSKYHIMQLVFPSNTFLQLKVLQLDLDPISTSININTNNNISSSSWQYPLFSQFSFDQIQASCPLLHTLIIKNFNMYLWYPKNKPSTTNTTSSSLWTNVQKTEACTTLKTLQLDNVIFYHSLCLVYLSLKYPYLKSLKLNIRGYQSIENDDDDNQQQQQHPNNGNGNSASLMMADNYKKALYLLMTQSPFITTLHIQFITTQFGRHWKSSYINTIAMYWPTNEMISWLEANPKRLKDIHFPCADAYQVDYHQPTHIIVPAISIATATTISGKNKTNEISLGASKSILNRRLYLCYITSLTLTFIHESPDKLLNNYFKSNPHNSIKNEYLQHLKTLKIINCDRNIVTPPSSSPSFSPSILPFEDSGVVFRQEQGRLRFNIYHWLDAIPQLQQLEIHGMVIEDKVEFHDHGVNSIRNPFPPSNTFSFHPLLKKKYQLEELKVFHSHIDLMLNLNGLCHSCPRLTKLHWKDVNYQFSPLPPFFSHVPQHPSPLAENNITHKSHDHSFYNNHQDKPSPFLSEASYYHLPSKNPLNIIAADHYFDDLQFRNVTVIDERVDGKSEIYKLNRLLVMQYADTPKYYYQPSDYNYEETLLFICQAFNRVRINDQWLHY